MINESFSAYRDKLKCQGALKHKEYLIDINGPDDIIFNLCLQVQSHFAHVIMLSNDINVQNKAAGTGVEYTDGKGIKQRLKDLCDRLVQRQHFPEPSL